MKSITLKICILFVVIIALAGGIISCSTTTAEPAATSPATPAATTPAPAAAGRTITDLSGREIQLPDEVNKVFGCSPIETNLIYMLAPDKLGGWNQPTKDELILQKYLDLPAVGGWFGTQSGNYEAFLALKPDAIFGLGTGNIDELQTGFGAVPVVYFGGVTTLADDYEASIVLAGDILGVEQQAQKLLNFYNNALDTVRERTSKIPENKRVRIYYAEGQNGLLTDPSGSAHSSLIEVCGGINVADVPLKKGMGQSEVSLEQIINWNPDVIIVGRMADKTVKEMIMTDSNWKSIKAVKDGRVYMRPVRPQPFPWFDGPPGPNQIIGIYWMAKTLYPDTFSDIDLKAKAQEFFRDFLHCTITDEQFKQITAN